MNETSGHPTRTYPLTYSQRGILISCRRIPGSTGYQLPSAIPFSNIMDASRLAMALQEVIRCRPMLRTRIIMSAGNQPRQYSDEAMRVTVPCLRMTEREALGYIEKGFVRPFDMLGPLPLCRFEIITTETHTWLLMDFHHIIADGITIAHHLLKRDLAAAYDGKPLSSCGHELYELGEQEHKLRGNRDYNIAKVYYDQLFRDTTFTTIPLRKDGGVGKDITISHRLSRTETDRWCDEHRVGANLLMMAAFCIVLSKWSHTPRVAFATLSHGRNTRSLRQAYGMFVKTVPFVSDVDPESVVLDYIRSLRAPLIASIRHAAYPYIDFCSDHHQSAVVSFAFQGSDIMEQVNLGNECVTGIQLHQGLVNSDLSCVVYTHEDHYELRIDASSACRDAHELKQFASSMDMCLNQMMAYPACKVGDLELVEEEEKRRILALSQGAPLSYDHSKTLIGMTDEQTRLTPHAIAVNDGTVGLTYLQLQRQSGALACWLMSQGVGQGDFVGIEGVACSAFVVAALAVMRAGAAYVPTDPSWPLSYRKAIMAETPLKATLHPLHLPEAKDEGSVPDHSSPDGLAYMIFTSGSTGRAKGVMIPHRALTNLLHFIVRRWRLDSHSRISCHSSLSFDASVEDLYPVLTVGGTLYIMPDDIRHDIGQIHQFIDRHRITGGCYTTSLGQLIASRPHPTLDYICLGGERMTEVPHATCRVINTYGPTEFCVDATYYELEPGRKYKSIPIGRPLDNLSAYVTDHHGHLLPWGVTGELCLGGIQMSSGYWNDTELTGAKFTSCPFANTPIYHTGDLVRWNDDNELEFVGRLDNIVKVNGYRVSLDELERHIVSLSHITAACVSFREEAGRGQLCAYYTTDGEVDEKEVRSQLRTVCPSYMLPTIWIRLDQMPRLSNGKTDRQRLPQPTSHHDSPPAAAPTRREQMICDVYRHVLGLGHVGVDDDFFDLGGTSLSVMSLMSEMEAAGYKMTYDSVFKYPTPRFLSEHIADKEKKDCYTIEGNYQHIRRFLAGSGTPKITYSPPTLCGDTLLTGSTGFLGIHVLHELLNQGAGNVYCIVRGPSEAAALQRLQERYKFYFSHPLDADSLTRIHIIPLDLTSERIVGEISKYEVSRIINCAANVKHFAKSEDLISVNSDAVKKLAECSERSHARLVHISTLGIAGLSEVTAGQKSCLTERDFYIGQRLGDAYTYSKWVAERHLLEKMPDKRLDAVIMRVGNLSPRSYDGRFQYNPESNGLMVTLRLFSRLGMMPQSAADIRTDLSPVDTVAKAVLRLSEIQDGLPVWHVADPHHLALYDAIQERGCDVEVVEDRIFEDELEKAKSDKELQPLIVPAVGYLSIAGQLKPNGYESSLTAEVLEQLGVKWKD